MDYSVAEKQAVHEAFEALLEGLDASDGEPDQWEEECLARALAAMICGRYRVAAVLVTKAGDPANRQYSAGAGDARPSLTKEDFRRGLEALRQIAVGNG
jgi:hypothetical protein